MKPGRDWKAAAQRLKRAGFTAAFVGVGTAGAAYYPSDVLARARNADPKRDELGLALAAFRGQGIEVHAVHVCWYLGGAPTAAREKARAENRVQVDVRKVLGERFEIKSWKDKRWRWLCPSVPRNRRLERDAILEIAERYKLDGIQLDFMRFTGEEVCFCDHCRRRFEKETAAPVRHWPQDVWGGGERVEQWRAWRRDLMTSFVAEVAEELRKRKPGIRLSLAARSSIPWAKRADAQDWPLWVKRGYLHFVCPMDYSPKRSRFVGRLRPQLEVIRSLASDAERAPLYVGIGSYLMKEAGQLEGHVRTAAEMGVDGCVLFDLDHTPAPLLDVPARVLREKWGAIGQAE